MSKAILAVMFLGLFACDDVSRGSYADGYADARADNFECASVCNATTQTCDGFELCIKDCLD
jgi:hypothetical protein